MTIAKLAEAGGVGVETVRFYQRRGLLDQPDRDGGVRHYSVDDAKRLRFIRAAQAAGFTLEEIGLLLGLDATDNRAQVRAMARDRVSALDAKIAGLQSARDALDRLATRCAHEGAGPCPILTAFEA